MEASLSKFNFVLGVLIEEERMFRADNPTCSREEIIVAVSLIAANSWTLNPLDIKTAFLKGKYITREVFVKPRKEAKSANIWKLKKTVYRLADTIRYWHLKIWEELIHLGAIPSQYNQGIF